MDALALNLANKERQRLKNLTTVGVNSILADLQTYDAYEVLSRVPENMTEFLNLSSISAANNYSDTRLLSELQTRKTYSRFTPEPLLYPSRSATNTLYGGIGHTIKNIDAFEDTPKIFTTVSGIVEKAIFNNWRSTIQDNAFKDSDAKFVDIITAPNACAYCLWLKAGQAGQVGSGTGSNVLAGREAYKFHDNCRCVFGTVFKAEDLSKYETPKDRLFMEAIEKVRKDGVIGAEATLSALRKTLNIK